MNKQSIILFLSEYFDDRIIEKIVTVIKREFHCEVIVKNHELDIMPFYSPERRQYDANKLLKVISEIDAPLKSKKLALFGVDLFIPILTFLFGQSVLNGNTGVISHYRLRNELYGIKRDEILKQERLTKVIIHEIGHMFGLIHCQNPVCIMNSSTYVEHIDQKKAEFCEQCRTILNANQYNQSN